MGTYSPHHRVTPLFSVASRRKPQEKHLITTDQAPPSLLSLCSLFFPFLLLLLFHSCFSPTVQITIQPLPPFPASGAKSADMMWRDTFAKPDSEKRFTLPAAAGSAGSSTALIERAQPPRRRPPPRLATRFLQANQRSRAK